MPTTCRASGSCSSSWASRQSCRCRSPEAEGISLFLDSESEITTQPSRRDLPLMAHKSKCYDAVTQTEKQPVPEFFAVDVVLRALLLCAVKGGVSCHQTSYLRFSRFNLSLFLRLHFFHNSFDTPPRRIQIISRISGLSSTRSALGALYFPSVQNILPSQSPLSCAVW